MIALPSGVIVSLSQSKNTRNTLRARIGGGGGAGGAGGGAPKRTLRLATTLCVLYSDLYLPPPIPGANLKVGSVVAR